MASITVAGQAVAAVTPDRATLDLGLTHVGLTASAAMDAVAARSDDLQQVSTRRNRVPPPATFLKTADSGPLLAVNAGEIELQATVFIRFTTLPR